MSDLAIAVENLSKCFHISHESPRSRRYRTLRDDLVELPRRLLTRFAKNGKVTSEIFWALKNISFEVRQGEVIGIIGRNGAGKSTLLKILTRITEPTSGFADIYGRVGALLEVGTGFNPEFTGRENIFLNGAILGMSRAEIRKKFDEIVAFAEIEQFLDTPVKRYSSGMYLRLAFAVAAHLEPDIVVIDEGLAVGDAEFQKKCLGKMSEVSRSGRTVLFVSHNMSTVSALCDRTIVLREGAVVFDGATEEGIRIYTLESQAVAESKVDLANRTVERYGERRYACLQTLELLNSDGMPSTTLQMGEKAVFRLVIDVLRPSDNFEIGIVIGNFQGVAVHYLVSAWEGLHSIPEKGLHSVEVELPSINVFPGDYQVHVWIAINGQYY